MIGASTVETALEAVLQQDLDARLLRCRKTIASAEVGDLKTTHRLGQHLRKVLRSIADDPNVTPAQREQAADLYQRQRKFDPRVLDRKAEQEAEEGAVDPIRREYDPADRLAEAIAKDKLESKPAADGFEKGLIDLPAAIARVRDRFSSPSRPDDLEILAVALPGATDQLLIQLYLGIAYWFKELGGAFESGRHGKDLLPPAAQWVLNALANKSRTIAFPRPNCFSIADEIAFRSV